MRTREATLDDAAAWAEITVSSAPLVLDAASAAHEMRTDPPDVIRLVSESDDGTVIGIARLRIYSEGDHASLMLMVHPDHRRRGAGRALLDALSGELAASGKSEVHAITEDDGQPAATAWGFELTRTFRMAALDPRTLAAPSSDDRVVPLAQRDIEEIFDLHNRVVGDDPSGLSMAMPWEDWLADWQDPRNRPELSHGVIAENTLVAFSALGAAGERAWSNMTGVAPGYRGRGFGLLAKTHTLHAAATAGITRCMTGNDAQNAAMVAINDRLGYQLHSLARLAVRPIAP